jgi:hypothetical protein
MQLDFTRVLPAEPDTNVPLTSYRYTRHQIQALTAAEEELIRQRREAIRMAAAKEENKEDELASEKAAMPLNIEWKILTFLFPGMLQLIFSTAFRAEGYNRKAKDLTNWTLLGFVFYAILISVAVLL